MQTKIMAGEAKDGPQKAVQQPPIDKVTVAIRVRPFLEKEDHSDCFAISNNNLLLGGERQFAFDHIFTPDTKNEEVFDTVCQTLCESFASGINATIFAYGQTGAGKSFTMDAMTKFGVQHVFSKLREGVASAGASDADESGTPTEMAPKAGGAKGKSGRTSGFLDLGAANLTVSILEIYNDNIFDLMPNSTARGGGSSGLRNATAGYQSSDRSLPLREDAERGVVVQGAEERTVTTEQECMQVIRAGCKERSTASTLLNERSSRSHMVVTMTLATAVVAAKLHFVDLAGSERIKKSHIKSDDDKECASGSSGVDADDQAFRNTARIRECISINSGLLALGNVITALCERKAHIPYRDSKLTRLLQSSLGGNCRTVMVACVGPSSSSFEETLSTLKYARRAKMIQNNPTINFASGDVTGMDGRVSAELYNAVLEELKTTKALVAQQQQKLRNVAASPQAASPVTPGQEQQRAGSASSGQAMSQQTAERIARLEAEVATLKKNLATEKGLVSQLENDLFNAEYQAMTALNEKTRLQGEIKLLRDDGAGSTQQRQKNDQEEELLQRERMEDDEAERMNREAVSDQLAVLQRELRHQSEYIETLEGEKNEAEREVEELSKRIEEVSSAKEMLQDELRRALHRLEKTEKDTQRRELARRELEAQFSQKLQQAEARASEFMKRKKEAEALIRQKAASQEAVRRFKHEAQRIHEAYDTLKTKFISLSTQHDRQKVKHSHELTALQKRAREAESKAARLQQLLQRKEETMAKQKAGGGGGGGAQNNTKAVELCSKISALDDEIRECAVMKERISMVSTVSASSSHNNSFSDTASNSGEPEVSKLTRGLQGWKNKLAVVEKKLQRCTADEETDLQEERRVAQERIRTIERYLPSAEQNFEEELTVIDDRMDSLVASKRFLLRQLHESTKSLSSVLNHTASSMERAPSQGGITSPKQQAVPMSRTTSSVAYGRRSSGGISATNTATQSAYQRAASAVNVGRTTPPSTPPQRASSHADPVSDKPAGAGTSGQRNSTPPQSRGVVQGSSSATGSSQAPAATNVGGSLPPLNDIGGFLVSGVPAPTMQRMRIRKTTPPPDG